LKEILKFIDFLEISNFSAEIGVTTVMHFLVEFSVASIKSILFGFGSGAVSCLIHKTFEDFGHHPTLETSLIFLMALFCYTLAEISGMAAIVCIFVFGIV
jgi:NhaP-type Na+/H+ or K+/H+ antiporter